MNSLIKNRLSKLYNQGRFQEFEQLFREYYSQVDVETKLKLRRALATEWLCNQLSNLVKSLA